MLNLVDIIEVVSQRIYSRVPAGPGVQPPFNRLQSECYCKSAANGGSAFVLGPPLPCRVLPLPGRSFPGKSPAFSEPYCLIVSFTRY